MVPYPRATLPRHLAGRPFTISEARQAGVSYRLLSSDRVRRPFRGVYYDAAIPSSPLLQCLCALTYAPWAAATGLSALLLHGITLPSFYRVDCSVHLVAPASRRSATVPPGVTLHRFTSRPSIIAAPRAARFYTVPPVEAWVAAAAHRLGVEELVILGDRLLDRKHPFATVAQLRSAVGAAAGSRGACSLRAALALIRPGTDSAMETWVRLRIREAGLPEPQVNPQVRGYQGIPIGHVDMAYLCWRIAVYYDGDQHRTNRWDWYKDTWDDDYLKDDDWMVIRVNASHISQPGEFISRIQLAIQTQQRRRVPPYPG